MDKTLTRLGIAGAALVFALMAGLVLFSASIVKFSSRPAGAVDGIVVLTGGERRVQAGLDIFALGAAQRILISGVNRSTTREELKRTIKMDPVLFNCCVDVGYQALDTVGNANEARDWAATWRFKRVAIVTSSYHMPRSLIEFARAMPDVEFVPLTVGAHVFQRPTWWLHWGTVRLVLIEYVKSIPAAARWAVSRAVAIVAPGREGERQPDGAPLSNALPLPRLSGLRP